MRLQHNVSFNVIVFALSILAIGFPVTANAKKLRLADYIKLLNVVPRDHKKPDPSNEKKVHALSNGNQISFRTSGDTALANVKVTWYSGTECTGVIQTITLTGGITLGEDTYISTDASNYFLCQEYSNRTTGNSGCAGLFADAGSGAEQSMQFQFNYTGGGSANAPCMNVGSTGNYEAQIDNSSASPAACSSGSNCGYSQPYVAYPLPPNSTFKIIFQTFTHYTGGNFNGSSGLSGADAECQHQAYIGDGGGPSVITNGLTFKALLVASTRYPCDSTGACGSSAWADWPLATNTGYALPGSPATAFVATDDNGIFETSYTSSSFEDQTGGPANYYLWSGINGIRLADVLGSQAPLVGWSYANESANWTGGLWNSYGDHTCSDWHATTSDFNGMQGEDVSADSSFSDTILTAGAGYDPVAADNDEAYISRWVSGIARPCYATAAIICVSQ